MCMYNYIYGCGIMPAALKLNVHYEYSRDMHTSKHVCMDIYNMEAPGVGWVSGEAPGVQSYGVARMPEHARRHLARKATG